MGCLAPEDYRQYVLPYSRQVLSEVAATGVPVIHFGADTATLLPAMAEAGGTVIGLDWRISLAEGWRIAGEDKAVQGNLDPVALFAPRPELETRVRHILAQAGGQAGHIFNTGHGLLPETPVDNVRAVVDMVHDISSMQRGIPMPDERIGLLVMAYGGPNNLDEVEPYLKDVRGGRTASSAVISEVYGRYRRIGGSSPILQRTQAQAMALQAALNMDGATIFQAFVGMRHWHPYIAETLEWMAAAGIRHAVGLVMAPHYSRMSIGEYYKRVEQAQSPIEIRAD